jgi:hypothetical protein
VSEPVVNKIVREFKFALTRSETLARLLAKESLEEADRTPEALAHALFVAVGAIEDALVTVAREVDTVLRREIKGDSDKPD